VTATARTCIRCHPPAPDAPPIPRANRYICDRCTESIRTHRPTVPAGGTHTPPPQSDKRKSKRRRTSRAKTLATVLALLLLPLVGCSYHREASLECGPIHYESTTDVDLNPTLLTLSRPAAEPES
jgi:hypothetical protein